MKIEYRVRPVTRYVVTRFHQGNGGAGVDSKGEFGNEHTAYDVAYALCKDEHERLGYPPGDERVQYPHPVQAENVTGPQVPRGGRAATSNHIA